MAERRTPNANTSAFSSMPFLGNAAKAADAAIAERTRIHQYAIEIKKQKQDPGYQNVPFSDDRPLSNYSDVLDRLEAISAASDAPPMPKLPGLAARLSRAKFKPSISSVC